MYRNLSGKSHFVSVGVKIYVANQLIARCESGNAVEAVAMRRC